MVIKGLFFLSTKEPSAQLSPAHKALCFCLRGGVCAHILMLVCFISHKYFSCVPFPPVDLCECVMYYRAADSRPDRPRGVIKLEVVL